ncbi:hypothetical protein B0H14DRAFT_2616859 [Mycena olivaceomarginata]|nr:hypothetical protein B0H14DRAFT_2616859 [Mycena olivaceomarginata]
MGRQRSARSPGKKKRLELLDVTHVMRRAVADADRLPMNDAHKLNPLHSLSTGIHGLLEHPHTLDVMHIRKKGNHDIEQCRLRITCSRIASRPETSSCSAKLFAFAGSSGIYKNQGDESEIAAIYASCRGIKLDDREVFKGVCKSLDGVSLFAITPTGSGKTSYYILHILIILEIIKDPDLCPSADFPKNPVLLVICPTIPLQIEMASNMTKLGLKAMAINSETKTVAQQEDKDLWRLARTEPNVVLTGPEQLKTADFEKAIRDTTFYEPASTRCTCSTPGAALFEKNSSRWAFSEHVSRITITHGSLPPQPFAMELPSIASVVCLAYAPITFILFGAHALVPTCKFFSVTSPLP